MKDRVITDIGAKEPLQDWADINWKRVKKRVRNLRRRIYRASQEGQWNRVRSLMKLMLRSYSNLLLSIRRVTQENQGKKTAGIDGQVVKTPKERVQLANDMRTYRLWQAHPARRVYIPKANGKKQRPLGIPTVKNRVVQAIVKNALEPCWEAQFESHSYGFRPGRSCQDAIEQCHSRLRKGADVWILDADIKGAFDNISHEYILNTIGNIPGRELIKQWLKAGYVEAQIFHPTDSGTAQGGIISPLLANIALNGIEELLSQFKKVKEYQYFNKKKGKQCICHVKSDKYGFIRYADDFLITATQKEDIEAIKPIIQDWLKHRGLELNSDKTKIVHIEQGFNYLGFNVRQYKGKCLITPEKQKVKDLLQRVRGWLKSHSSHKPEAVINYLNPILRGWANYYRHAVSARVFSSLDHYIWKAVFNWCRRRHPGKGKRWVVDKYFKTLRGQKWYFASTLKNRRGRNTIYSLMKLATIPIERHVKVKGTASPDDPALKEYWHNRQTRQGKIYWNKGSKHYQVAEAQNWRCTVCGEHLLNGEQLQTHHIIKVTDGGSDRADNLLHLHKICHQHLHMGQSSDPQKA